MLQRRQPGELAPIQGFDCDLVIPGSRSYRVHLYEDMGLDNPTTEELIEAGRELRAWLKLKLAEYEGDCLQAFSYNILYKGYTGKFCDEFLLEIRKRREVKYLGPGEFLVLMGEEGDEEKYQEHLKKRAEYFEKIEADKRAMLENVSSNVRGYNRRG